SPNWGWACTRHVFRRPRSATGPKSVVCHVAFNVRLTRKRPSSGHRPIPVIAAIRETGVTEYLVGSRGLLRLNASELDHLAPLFHVVRNDLPEGSRRATEHGTA